MSTVNVWTILILALTSAVAATTAVTATHAWLTRRSGRSRAARPNPGVRPAGLPAQPPPRPAALALPQAPAVPAPRLEVIPFRSKSKILPGTQASVVVNSKGSHLCPQWIVLDRPNDWVVLEVKIGNRSVFAQSGKIPGEALSGNFFTNFVVQPMMDFSVTAVYVGADADGGTLSGCLFGADRTVPGGGAILPMSSEVDLLPGKTMQVTARPQVPVTPRHFVISDAQDWVVHDVTVENRRVLPLDSPGVPAHVLCEGTRGISATMGPVSPGCAFSIVVEYVGPCAEGAPFLCGVVCDGGGSEFAERSVDEAPAAPPPDRAFLRVVP